MQNVDYQDADAIYDYFQVPISRQNPVLTVLGRIRFDRFDHLQPFALPASLLLV